VWGRAESDPYEDELPEATPARLRSRIGASLVIVALLGATARGGWLVFAGPIPIRGPRAMPSVAFVVRCPLSHESSDDPILLPGQAGRSHRHAFFGNTATDASSTVGSLLARSTSCDDPADTAAYWLPTPVGARWTAIRAYYGAGGISTLLRSRCIRQALR
jgi:Domain of unknown function (DUF1996)